MVVTIEAVRANGVDGRAQVGDLLTVDFRLATAAGAPLELSTMARGAIMVSGPTFNYQRVIASQSDLIARSTKRAIGAYRYQFAVPMPAVYEPPYNDTTDSSEGELTGQALLAGTYTVGIELRKDYTVDDVTYRDPGDAAFDFLVGDATTIDPREVVTLANCNRCHGELRAHGDNRSNLTNCLLCHTSGSEDRNVATAAGGTPGASVDFKVMIHKIHAGKHLPSVNGVSTNPDGTRNYADTPRPYELVGFNDTVHDYSHVALPAWPSLAVGMPRDTEYATLSSAEQSLENTMLASAVDCAACHGDPDGDGPLPAPAQGDLAYTQPTVASCNSCHDDWNPDFLYTANGQTMPAERDNATCKECHRPSGGPLDVRDAHTHPLTDSNFTRGLRFNIESVTDGSGGTTFDPGDRVRISMTLKDRDGADVPATSLARMEVVLNGPTTSPNLVHFIRVQPEPLGSGPDYAFNVPQNYYYEPVGTSDGSLQTFSTSRAPHWNVNGAATTLRLATGATSVATLAVEAPAAQNYVDLAAGGGAGFADGDYILVEPTEPSRREYLRVQRVDGDRLWFGSLRSASYAPAVRVAHAAGALLVKAETEEIPTASYVLDATTGLITETTEFGAGEVIVSYTSEFVVPDRYPGTLNESPDLDQSWGDWVGLPLLSGTYNLGIYGELALPFTVTVGAQSQTTNYNEVAPAAVVPLLFGSATEVEQVARIDSADGCYRCHGDLQFHGNHRRGYDGCLLCHGVAGAEDAPQYVYGNAPATPGVTIDFRSMVHKIHAGKELDAGANYQVVGFGGNPHSYEEVGYPLTPGGVANCTSCHGQNSTAWVVPLSRVHPNATLPSRDWRAACNACHDSAAERAHIDANTSPTGEEACAICHGMGEAEDVRTVHTVK